MRTATPKSTTETAAKSNPQSRRIFFETAAMVVEIYADRDDGVLSDDDLSVSI